MKKFSAVIVTILILSLVFSSVSAASLPPAPEEPKVNTGRVVNKFEAIEPDELDFVSETGRYIVTFTEAPVAASQVWKGKVDPQAEETPQVQAYKASLDAAAQQLEAIQVQKLQEMRAYLGKPDLFAFYHYTYVLNGVSVALSPKEAMRVAQMPGVKAVYPVTIEQPMTDSGPQWVGAPAVWDGTAMEGVAGTKGEGILVGILDTGINFDHPSFSDDPADGFTYSWNGSYKGVCNPYDAQAAAYPGYTAMCNKKLVGAFSYMKEALTPEDDDGHGTHTASTVAGNTVEVEIKGVTTTMSGVAPHAQIIAFDVCDADGCWGDASVKAVNDALREGVDALNYSISGGKSPYTDGVEQAFLEATSAGMFVATSGGNLRNETTVDGNVNHVSPWVMTVAASSHDRKFSPAFSIVNPAGSTWVDMVLIPSNSPVEWTPVADVEVVWGAEHMLPDNTDNRGGCEPFPAGFFAGKIAAINRGVCTFAVKVTNATNAGAIGVIGLADNRPPISWGGLDGSTPESILATIPVGTLYLTVDETRAFEAFMTANKPVRMSISETQRLVNEAWGDIKADFSFRGPSASNLPIVKPDITAPGLEILAAYADQALDMDGSADVDLLQGTSMSSPHVAGLGALMKAVHPSWSVAEIKSALMMTAITENLKKTDMVTPADPFDYGSGRAWVSDAVKAGMVLSETRANFEAADPSKGGDPRTLNLASMQENMCLGECSWTRTFKSVAVEPVEYKVEAPAWVTVTPARFTIQPGATQTVSISANSKDFEVGDWQYAYIYFRVVPQGSILYLPVVAQAASLTAPVTPPVVTPPATPIEKPIEYADLHLSLAMLPASSTLVSKATFETHRDADTGVIPNVQAMTISDLTIDKYGWTKGTLQTIDLAKDSTNLEVYDDLNQVYYTTVGNQGLGIVRFVAEITSTTASDLDLYWGYDLNGDGMPQPEEEAGYSATSTALEYVSVILPSRNYNIWILVQNYTGSAATTDSITISTALVPFAPINPVNMTVVAEVNGAPAISIPAGQPFDLRVGWDVPTVPGDRLYGLMDAYTDGSNDSVNIGFTVLDVIVGTDDVVKTASPAAAGPNQTVTFSIDITNYYPTDMAYTFSDVIPAGMTYVPDSVTGGAVYDPATNSITWSGVVDGPGTPHYVMTSSNDDPDCTDWYLDVYGINPTYATNPDIAGDESYWTYNLASPINFYGTDYSTMAVTDDGQLAFAPASYYAGATSYDRQAIPDTAKPNNHISLLWQDMVIVYDQATNSGVSSLNFGQFRIISFNNVQLKSDPSKTYKMQAWIFPVPDKSSAPEIVIAYDLVNGPTDGATVGIENFDGTLASPYTNGGATITNGFNVCYDWYTPSSTETITFEATVNSDASFPLTNTVVHDNAHPGTRVEESKISLERDPASVDVVDEATLRAALADTTVNAINIKADFPVASQVVVDRPMTIHGENHTLTFADGSGSRLVVIAETTINNLTLNAGLTNPAAWASAYGIQVYNTEAVLNNVTATGGNAGLMVNSADVFLVGTITLSGNGFGGMEVSQSPTLSPVRKPTLKGSNVTFVNTDDANLKPTIWVDKYAVDFLSESPVTLTGGTQFTPKVLTTDLDGKDQLHLNIAQPLP